MVWAAAVVLVSAGVAVQALFSASFEISAILNVGVSMSVGAGFVLATVKLVAFSPRIPTARNRFSHQVTGALDAAAMRTGKGKEWNCLSNHMPARWHRISC